MFDLPKIIREEVQKYLAGTQLTTWDINNGNCEDFATIVFDRIGGYTDMTYGIWLEDIAEDGPNHYVIYYNGRYYDAECPDGVDDWRMIPCYLNQNKTRQQVLDERNS